jgi:hypothetical protein
MLAYVLVIAVIAARILFRPLAFAPVAPVLLFFGSRAPRKMLWLPLAVLTATDLYLTYAVYNEGLKADQLITSAWYVAVLLLGSALLKGGVKPLRVGAAALSASISFFVASNFAVWAVWPTYPKTASGLMACYVAAIPFFRSQFASDMIFTAVIFGLPAAIAALRPKDAEDHIAAA